jgi:hypothetical protein
MTGADVGRLRIESVILTIRPLGPLPSLTAMTHELTSQLVELTFVGRPPARQIARASGVTNVEVDGCLLRCEVQGSFQPLLEAVRGYEVISLTSIPASDGGG